MPHWLHRTSKQFLQSVASADLPEPLANYIEQPDLSAVTGQPSKYWEITGDAVTLADQATRDAIDAAELEASRDATMEAIENPEGYERNFALAILDEFNLHAERITAILDAIDGAANLAGVKTAIALIPDVPQRTKTQLKAAALGKFG